MNSRFRYTVKLLCCLSFISLFIGCAGYTPPPENLNMYPQYRWGNAYRFNFDPPSKAPATSVPVVMAVVNPSYQETDSVLMQKVYRKLAKGFSASMGVDMDKLLVAKGMTTLGPYSTLDDIVYSSKKNASLTLAPTVFITQEMTYLEEWRLYKGRTPTKAKEYRMGRQFKMSVSGWVAFIMREPLSGEKMWVKKLQLEDQEITGMEYRDAVAHYTPTYGFFGEKTGETLTHHSLGSKVLFDGRTEALADALKALYPTIMQKCWTYMDTNELEALKKQSKEIRERKRY